MTATPMEDGFIRIPKTAELVAASLRRDILSRAIEPGSRLPPEAELTARFRISRPTLREAYRLLEADSLIHMRRGAKGGAIVQVPNRDVVVRHAGVFLQYQRVSLADVHESRALLEVPAAGVLAARRTKADLAALRACLEESEGTLDDPHQVTSSQTDFHRLIVELAGNRTLAFLSDIVDRLISTNVERYLGAGAVPGGELHQRVRAAQKAHARLVDLIEERDVDGASQLWRRHLTESSRFALASSSEVTVTGLLD